MGSSYSSGGGSNSDYRNSVMLPSSGGLGLGSETAKYNREEAIKSIHSDFTRRFEEDQRKYWPGRSSAGDARSSLIAGTNVTAPVTAMDEVQARKEIVK